MSYEQEFNKVSTTANLTTNVISMIHKALDGYGRAFGEIISFTAAVGGRSITNENVICLSTEGLGYTRLCKELHEAKIPHIAVANDKDTTVFVAIPKEYEQRASLIAEKINSDVTPTWVNRKDLTTHSSPDLGGRPNPVVTQDTPTPKTVTFQNLSPEEMTVLKQELAGTHIAAALNERQDGSGSITVVAGGEKEELARQAVVGAKMYFMQRQGDVLRNEIRTNLEAREHVEKYLENVKSGKTVFVSDKADGTVYRIDNKGIYMIAEKGKNIEEKPIISHENGVYRDNRTGRELSEKTYRNEVYATIAEVKMPDAHTYNRSGDGKYTDISGHTFNERGVSKALIEESARYIASTAREDASNGYVQLATDANHLIQALSGPNRAPGSNEFNNHIENIISTLDDRTIAIGEDQYRMSPDELTAILSTASSHPAIVDADRRELDEILQQVGASTEGQSLNDALMRIRKSQDIREACIDVLQKFERAAYLTAVNTKVNERAESNTKDKDRDIDRGDRNRDSQRDRDDDEYPDRGEDEYPDVD